MTNMQDIRKKSEKDLAEVVEKGRQTLRHERFKDAMSRKASIIRGAKTEIARALTELNARRRNQETK
jgi:ribosomal protein L29